MVTQTRWQQAKALFQQAIERAPAEREAFINAQIDEPALREEVMKLLRLHDASPGFLDSPLERASSVDGGSPNGGGGADPLIGRRLGEFVILRRLGAGGMGAVYEAQQEQPARKAAVKVLRAGFVTAETIRRFEFEAQVLAKLQHPGIAHVYAAGVFDSGDGAQPWFAMELIDGLPLHRFAEGQSLALRAKLELLLEICDAVQHAHQRGVIHRDLKPANILVQETSKRQNVETSKGEELTTETDLDVLTFGRFDVCPRPKILDFGVARVIGPDAPATMHTTVGTLVGTLNYMSPEQLSADPDDVDARCDVYALGVVGYELLTGRLPHERASGTAAQTILAIEHDAPPRLGALDAGLRGDVETIFAKALEKDRQRRYQSAAELAADIRRFLNHEPILARKPTALYQLSRFARRNRALVGGVAATFVALVAGVVMYAMEARQARLAAARATYEADKATAINNFITNDFLMNLLTAANAGGSDGGSGEQPREASGGEASGGSQRIPIEQLVASATANISSTFAGQPLAEAAVRNEVGTIYYNLGAWERSGEQFQLALNLWEANLGPDHPDTLKAVNNLGQTLAVRQRPDEAEALYRRALDGRARILGEDDPFTLVSMNNLGALLRGTGRLDEAETLLRRALASQQRVHGEANKNTFTTMSNLASLLIQRGRLDDAIELLRRTHELSAQTLGPEHLTTLSAASLLGQALHRAGSFDEAQDLLLQVVEGFEQVQGGAHNSTISARRALARTLEALDRRDDAIAQLRVALEGVRAQPQSSERAQREIEAQLAALESPTPQTMPAKP